MKHSVDARLPVPKGLIQFIASGKPEKKNPHPAHTGTFRVFLFFLEADAHEPCT